MTIQLYAWMNPEDPDNKPDHWLNHQKIRQANPTFQYKPKHYLDQEKKTK